MKFGGAIVVCCMVSVGLTGSGQSRNRNYVKESTMTAPFKDDPCTDYDMARSTVRYFDGLGRPVQSAQVGGSYAVLDIVSASEYDGSGRPYKSWLPVESTYAGGDFIDNHTVNSYAVSIYDDNSPYSIIEYDRTPDRRDIATYYPGDEWKQGRKRTSTMRGFNASGDALFGCTRYDADLDGSLIKNGEYDNGRLSFVDFTDEDGIRTIKFYNTEEQLVLERKVGVQTHLETYFVHDVIGRLTYIIPPKAALAFTDLKNGECDSQTVKELCFYYKYDQYNRVIERRMPGCEPELLVYDKLDNIALRQDGNLRKESKWRVIKLDRNLRLAVEGIAAITGQTQASLQEQWKNKLAIESTQPALANWQNMFYTDTCGLADFKPLVAYFYDDYDFWDKTVGEPLPSDDNYSEPWGNAMGRLTGKAVWEGNVVLLTAYKYDERKRLVMECSYDLDKFDNYSTLYKYNFGGDMIGKKSFYNSSDLSIHYTSEYKYDYDNWGRVMSVQHRLNGGDWTSLYHNMYDNLARLSQKSVYPRKASSKPIKIDYSYNLRGWTTGISSPLFQQTLHYNDNITGSTARWNGTPAAMSFTSINAESYLDSMLVAYRYDDFDRLTEVKSLSSADTDELFSEAFTYDSNSNPVSISRGKVTSNPVQYITLDYIGNQIGGLHESKPVDGLYPEIPSIRKGDYSSGWNYDANGNRTTDPAKGITAITYDVNNRPTKMIFADGSFVENRYRSDGTLYGIYEHEALMSTLTDSGTARRQFRNVTTYYLGDLVFTNTLPSRLYIDGGYIDFDIEHGIPPVYHYYIADNQGSTRVIIDENGNTVQATDYSAYGVPSTRMATFPADNRLHLGLQWQATKGIFGYYNNARFRDPTLAGTFLQPDKLADSYTPFTPYLYAKANPIRFCDEDGNQAFAIHGTWSNNKTWKQQTQLNKFVSNYFGNNSFDYSFEWLGLNTSEDRLAAALHLTYYIKNVSKSSPTNEPITIIGHSHGGNVAIQALNIMVNMPEFNNKKLNLLTINTPVRKDYQLTQEAQERVMHLNIYDPKDPIQVIGGNSNKFVGPRILGELGFAQRKYKNALNIEVEFPQGILGDFHNSHNRVRDWSDKIFNQYNIK